METQKQSREESHPSHTAKSKFETQLQEAIISHLTLLSEEGKEKVLDFINELIDAEQKKSEFNRRQGRLYNWVDARE
jgi:AAA+ ATPase superfamily predicted ATPase